jgi:hypothetical protein
MMQSYPEGPGKDTPLGPLASKVFASIINVYGGHPKPSDFDIYTPDAVFEDPLMIAKGVPQIKSAFYSLGKLFSVSQIVEWNVTEKENAPGNGQVSIDNKQHYKMLGKEFDMPSLIVLTVKDGKVQHHEDRWNGKPNSGWTSVLRKGNMGVTHLLMGFGKDPK